MEIISPCPERVAAGIQHSWILIMLLEASPRNRLQKKRSNSSVNVESVSSLPSTNVRVNNAESGFANRKRQLSIQNQKGPMGPRPLDASSGKKYEEGHGLHMRF